MISTEQKIKEAFDKGFPNVCYPIADFILFRAGYLALLNDLERNSSSYGVDLYVLPEGVTKP